MRFRLCFLLLSLTVMLSKAQQLASPQIINYTSETYKGGVQNWDIAQDSHGVMYFGNNEGLLTFNGKSWNIHALPNATVLHALAIDGNDRIYVGGQDEIGYFYPDGRGVLAYHSLLGLLPPDERHFADIWNIVLDGDEVFFRSTSKIFHYKDNSIRIDKPKVEWSFLGKVNGQVIAHGKGGAGLLRYEHGLWKPFCQHEALDSSVVSGIIPYHRDTLLLSTLKNGLFFLHDNQLTPFHTALDALFKNDRIYGMTAVNNDWFAFGTTSAGVLLMDRRGRLVRGYDFRDGLQKNYIRHLYIDRNQNLWLALDDGIDFLAVNSAIKLIQPDANNQPAGYATHFFNGYLYIGTPSGLFAGKPEGGQPDLSLRTTRFGLVANSAGQVWSLNEVNGRLLMGHEDGAYVLNGDKAEKIYPSPGTWLFQPSSRVLPATDIIAGTYWGLHQVTYDPRMDRFVDGGGISGADESLRFLVPDEAHQDMYWSSHPNRGIFRLRLSADHRRIMERKLYTEKEGLPSLLFNSVFQVRNKVVAATADGIYEYNEQKDRFIPSPLFYADFKKMKVQHLYEDKLGNVWVFNDKKLWVADFTRPLKEKPYSLIFLPELNGRIVGGFESVFVWDAENVFIGVNKGTVHLNYAKYRDHISRPDVLIDRVMVTDNRELDSTVYGGHPAAGLRPVRLPYEMNSLHFAFSSTLFDQDATIEFSCFLKGFDKGWSAWGNKFDKDYTNLPPGDYVFQVKARNGLANVSAPASYAFTVRPAWYNSTWSFLAYALLACGLVYGLFKWQKRVYQQRHERQAHLQQLRLDQSQQRVMRLEKEKLEDDINHKNRELANLTMHLVQRGEVLGKIKEVMAGLAKKGNFNESSLNFRQLLRLIREVERTDEDWEQFSLHFSYVNEGFFTVLKEQFPDLTPNELKLCAFIRMNLSSKEIAQLMNITIKAVEVSRYRLRKKLHLQPDTNLYDFLLLLNNLESRER